MGDDDGLDALGLEFWLGQVILIAAVVAAVMLSARVGFESATDLERHEDFRHASSALAMVRSETEANLDAIRHALVRAKAGQQGPLALDTTYLDAAPTRAFMAVVDPAVLADVEALFAFPTTLYAARLRDPGALEPGERADLIADLTRVLDRAAQQVLPALTTEAARLEGAR